MIILWSYGSGAALRSDKDMFSGQNTGCHTQEHTGRINGNFRNRFIGGTDSIYKAYFSGLNFREYPENMALYGTNVPPF